MNRDSPLVDELRRAHRQVAHDLAAIHRTLDHPQPDPACTTCRILERETTDA